jgi:hypothetical protein
LPGTNGLVGSEQVRLSIAVRDLHKLRRCVVQHTAPGEADVVERVLGQLATLESLHAGRPDATIEWTPPPGTEALATRAIDALRLASERRRFRRDPWSERPQAARAKPFGSRSP